ncbi:MAG: glycosyltransferase family 4 protein [Gaiellaceae bacterium]
MTPDAGAPVPDQRVSILRVIARLNVGGPALHVAYLSAGLTLRGYDTTLVAGTIARGEESMAYIAEEAGARVVALPGLSREISPLHDALAIVRLARLIRQVRPTILHTHTAKAGTVGRVAALLAGDARPSIVVHTFHGHVLRGYFGPTKSAVFRVLERLLAKVTTVLVAVSPEVRDDLVGLGIAPAEKFAVVRLGIELEQRVATSVPRDEVRRQLGIPPNRFVVGWVGRMTGVKQTQDLLAALTELRAGGVDAGLLVVGDGPDRVGFEQRAHDLDLVRHCLFLGYQDDVAPWYAAMDAVALPSGNEGTPVTVIEALAAGKPVVAYEVGGVPDVVRDGVDGFLVAPGSTSGLAERLAQLAADPDLGRRLGAAGRKRVLERYGVGRLLDDIDRLYRETMERQSRR